MRAPSVFDRASRLAYHDGGLALKDPREKKGSLAALSSVLRYLVCCGGLLLGLASPPKLNVEQETAVDRQPTGNSHPPVAEVQQASTNSLRDSYRVLWTLGEGKRDAKLKLGVHVKTRQFVFIKRYDRWSLARRRLGANLSVRHVLREIEVLQSLRHPNVIRLRQAIAEDESRYIYLVMEYMAGGSITDKLNKVNRLSERLARKYFVDVVGGLEYLHACHIVHRDIKPGNLLLTGDEKTVKIGDFSIAHRFEEDDRLVDSDGSAAFLAPELISSEYEPRGCAVDIWALGVTLYYFVFGACPFLESGSMMGTFRKIRLQSLTFPAHILVSFALKDLLRKLLSKNPEKRITMEGIKRHPWYLDLSV